MGGLRGRAHLRFFRQQNATSGALDGRKAEGTSIHLRVTNLENDESVSFSGIDGDLIERYGHHPARPPEEKVEPDKILKVFDFIRGKDGR